MGKEYSFGIDLNQLVEEPQLDLFIKDKLAIESDYYEMDKIISAYQEFENKHPIKIINRNQFNTPVNFKQAKQFPRHRWYTYKEGFSPQFVEDFIRRFSQNSNDIVFDPFGGIGTTVLQSSILNHQSYSNDINPLSNYVASIKTNAYTKEDIDEINSAYESLIRSNLNLKSNPPFSETVTKYFSQETLESILITQKWISDIESDKVRNVFSLALLTILETLSTHKKDGNGVKRKNYSGQNFSLQNINELIGQKLKMFIDDISSTSINIKPIIKHQSSFDEYKLNQKADIVITSPPYANCFDYSKVYLVELWFGGFFKSANDQKTFRQSSITSHVHYKWEPRHKEFGNELVNNQIASYLHNKKLWDKKIPDMLTGYFSDMGKVLYELIPNLNRNATIGIVVGNSVYGGLPIASDILLSQIAIKAGFELIGIESYRTLTPSSQQLKIMRDIDKKYLRESLIILKWK